MNNNASTLKIVWTVFLFMPCVFYFILAQPSLTESTGNVGLSPTSLYIVLIFAALNAWFLPKLILQKKIADHKQESLPINDYFVVFIIRMVFAEAIAILGFAFSLGTKDTQQYLIFAAVSITISLLSYPSDQRVHNRII